MAGRGSVFWVDPYPTRFPLLSDFQQFIGKAKAARDEVFIPAWLNIIKPVALPIEPLPSSGTVNIFMAAVAARTVSFRSQW